MKTAKINEQQFAEIKKVVHSIVESFELKAAQSTEIFPSVPETLKTLKDMNLKIALCTISGEKAAKYIINHFGLAAFFDTLIMREHVPAVKPDPIHLEIVLAELKVGAQEAILVGDSAKDIICARRLKVLAVGVTTGISSMDALVNAGAHYVASSLTELPCLIMKLNKQLTEE